MAAGARECLERRGLSHSRRRRPAGRGRYQRRQERRHALHGGGPAHRRTLHPPQRPRYRRCRSLRRNPPVPRRPGRSLRRQSEPHPPRRRPPLRFASHPLSDEPARLLSCHGPLAGPPGPGRLRRSRRRRHRPAPPGCPPPRLQRPRRHRPAGGRPLCRHRRPAARQPRGAGVPQRPGYGETCSSAAACAEGRTTIVNAAAEPEVVCLAEMLGKMGAQIRGARNPPPSRSTASPLCTASIIPSSPTASRPAPSPWRPPSPAATCSCRGRSPATWTPSCFKLREIGGGD